MTGRWYYSHAGVTQGPLSTEEIKEHAARKLLLEDDWIWQDGTDRKDAVLASAALDFSLLAAVASAAPDWLADVAKLERTGPIPEPLPEKGAPDWLEDLRLWYGLELYAAAKTTLESPSSATQLERVPEWLESWIIPEPPKVPSAKEVAAPSASPQSPVSPPAAAPPRPAVANSAAAPIMAPPPAPVSLVQPTAPSAPPAQTSAVKPISSPDQAAGPSAAPVAKAVANPSTRMPSTAPGLAHAPEPPQPKPEDLLAEKSIQETGFDPRTGQILDPERFRKWQKASVASQPAVSNQSLFEVFRKARTAIEHWVDDDNNRPLIMAGDLDAIKKDVQMLAIFGQYQGYGSAMQDKLIHHLRFMVENRRKYYTARHAREY